MNLLLIVAALVAQAPLPDPIVVRCFYDDGNRWHILRVSPDPVSLKIWFAGKADWIEACVEDSICSYDKGVWELSNEKFTMKLSRNTGRGSFTVEGIEKRMDCVEAANPAGAKPTF